MRRSSRPRVTIATRLYEPEVSAASFRMTALAHALAAHADVEVVTTRPPTGATPAVGSPGIRVSRARVLRDRTGAIRGYLPYASFDVPAFFRLMRRRADILVAEAPPTTGFVTLLSAALRRRPFVYYPGDVWTDALVAMGAARPVIAVMRAIESRVVRRANAVLAVSAEVGEHLAALGAPGDRIIEVGNGVDMSVFHPDVVPERPGRPYFVYTGTMSEWQRPQVFVEALALLERTDVELRFFGQGVVEDELRELAERIAPGRVRFGGLVEPAESARWIRGSVASLVSIVPGVGYDFARPTKIYAAAACGTPVLFAGAAVGADLVRDADLGAAVPFDAAAVAEAMRAALEATGSGETERLRTRRADWAVAHVSAAAVGARAAAAVLGIGAARAADGAR